MQKKYIIFLLIMVLVFVAACSGKDEQPSPQCSKSSDCRQEVCKTAQCFSGQCSYNIKPNCCGNKQQDAVEDGKPGNTCTCPKDYGNCTAPAKMMVKGKEKVAQYVTNYCDAQTQCVKGLDPNSVVPIVLTQQLKSPLFTLDVILEYPNPIIMNKDTITFKLTLRDAKEDLDMPLILKRFQIVNNQRLFGQLSTTQGFNAVDQTLEIRVPLTGETGVLESKLSLTYKIDEKHGKRVKGAKNPDGSYQYSIQDELTTLSGSLASDLVVVDLK